MVDQPTGRFKDETGNEYGQLTVLRFVETRNRESLLSLSMQMSSRGVGPRSKSSQRKHDELWMFPSQAYAETARKHPDADSVRGARMGESETPRVRENRLPDELHTVQPPRLLHGAKTA
jgi:hypothetical protein